MNAAAAPLDARLNAVRADLADARLRGMVKATRFVEGKPQVVQTPVADVCDAPKLDAGLQTQLVCGATVSVFETRDGWSWCQAEEDGYVGYIASAALTPSSPSATHIVTAPRTFVYATADLKQPRTCTHTMGARLCVTDVQTVRGTDYAILGDGGAVFLDHLEPLNTWDVTAPDRDPVSIAETLLHTPYLWGASTAFGIDCSGLVQLSMKMAGRPVLRDSDMQEATIGTTLPHDPGRLERGDLVFWKGHVGIMKDATTLLHANAHTMMVSEEPLSEAIARIAYLHGEPTAFKRPS
ncbi:MAG: NlpC/P60 family protein [Pseudomonadota bacterium]